MSSYKTLPTPGNTEWFTHDRFGMFILFNGGSPRMDNES